ncbi:MAG: HAMP domain-containing protein [Alphaproteobacteria bacterium]|nr:HAMP domain-containing protein [Alphaproteobacteria bacterium]
MSVARAPQERAEPTGPATGADRAKSTQKNAGPLARFAGSIVQTLRRLLSVTIFSSLTRRIVVLNVAALAAFLAAVLYLNDFRAGIIEARVQSLRVQGEIIAGAIAASATAEADTITVDPDRLVQLQGDGINSQFSFIDPSLEFPINPERVTPLLRSLIIPTRTRARIYDRDGLLILDSVNIFARGEVLRQLASEQVDEVPLLVDWWNRASRWLRAGEYPLYQDYFGEEGKRYPEVGSALEGSTGSFVRVNTEGRLIVSIAVPIQRLRATVGALMLSTEPGEIDAVVENERWSIIRIFSVFVAITFVLSLLMAGTIAGPVRRLSAAAKRVQMSMNGREQIPDFTDRSDEIGDLSGSVRDMTNALYNRIEDIERFAADVAHELKNPLTSLRSAAETLPRAKTVADHDRLTAIILHDVRRLDRLISDISSASRLDAELVRDVMVEVDIYRLLEVIVAIQEEMASRRGIKLVLGPPPPGEDPLLMTGHDSRLAQVFNNLLDNAISFSPPGGTVSIVPRRNVTGICVEITDEGPGIRGNSEEIFRRFYTDRPDSEDFGNHSGLGLSISRQIIEAHKGTIVAQNGPSGVGARFVVTLPATGT